MVWHISIFRWQASIGNVNMHVNCAYKMVDVSCSLLVPKSDSRKSDEREGKKTIFLTNVRKIRDARVLSYMHALGQTRKVRFLEEKIFHIQNKNKSLKLNDFATFASGVCAQKGCSRLGLGFSLVCNICPGAPINFGHELRWNWEIVCISISFPKNEKKVFQSLPRSFLKKLNFLSRCHLSDETDFWQSGRVRLKFCTHAQCPIRQLRIHIHCRTGGRMQERDCRRAR